MDDEIREKFTEVLTILNRIESRQIRTTEMVENVKAHEPPVVGSFGTIDSGSSAEPEK